MLLRRSELWLAHPHYCSQQCTFVALYVFCVWDFGHSGPAIPHVIRLTSFLKDRLCKNLVPRKPVWLSFHKHGRAASANQCDPWAGGKLNRQIMLPGAGGQQSVALRKWPHPIDGYMGLRPADPFMQDFGQGTPPCPCITFSTHCLRKSTGADIARTHCMPRKY